MRAVFQIILVFIFSNLASANTSDINLSFSSDNRQVHLLELYTSEGCSSFPPADAWLGKLVDHPMLWKNWVPVAFHVDYWNDLGWDDPYSSAAYSRRQRNYQQQGGIYAVYTPGFVLDGREWRRWYSRDPQLALSPTQSPPQGKLTVTVKNNQIRALYSPSHALPIKTLQLHTALLGFDLVTDIKAGENKGRKLSHQFVVLDFFSSPSSKTGEWNLPLPQTAHSKTALAVWVTEAGLQQPIQATGSWLRFVNDAGLP